MSRHSKCFSACILIIRKDHGDETGEIYDEAAAAENITIQFAKRTLPGGTSAKLDWENFDEEIFTASHQKWRISWCVFIRFQFVFLIMLARIQDWELEAKTILCFWRLTLKLDSLMNFFNEGYVR